MNTEHLHQQYGNTQLNSNRYTAIISIFIEFHVCARALVLNAGINELKLAAAKKSTIFVVDLSGFVDNVA